MKLMSFTLFLVILLSCSSNRSISSKNEIEIIPPGTIQVANDAYYDMSEIGNIDWREYMYWTEWVFGKQSEEYLITLPDTTVWNEEAPCYQPLNSVYLNHPQFNDFPVVGITWQQAIDYSKWRSDRVFEQVLIEKKYISIHTKPTRETHFTTERYYANTLDTYLKDERFPYYPEYRLATHLEAKLVVNYSDSINAFYSEKCESKGCADREDWYSTPVCQLDTCVQDKSVHVLSPPTEQSIHVYKTEKQARFVHLHGNVSEWLAEPNNSIGSSWKSPNAESKDMSVTKAMEPNAWTGFRNICSWQKRLPASTTAVE